MDPGCAGTAPRVAQRVRNCWPGLWMFHPKGGFGKHLRMWIPASPWAAPLQPCGEQPGALPCTLTSSSPTGIGGDTRRVFRCWDVQVASVLQLHTAQGCLSSLDQTRSRAACRHQSCCAWLPQLSFNEKLVLPEAERGHFSILNIPRDWCLSPISAGI